MCLQRLRFTSANGVHCGLKGWWSFRATFVYLATTVGSRLRVEYHRCLAGPNMRTNVTITGEESSYVSV